MPARYCGSTDGGFGLVKINVVLFTLNISIYFIFTPAIKMCANKFSPWCLLLSQLQIIANLCIFIYFNLYAFPRRRLFFKFVLIKRRKKKLNRKSTNELISLANDLRLDFLDLMAKTTKFTWDNSCPGPPRLYDRVKMASNKFYI